MGRFRDPLTCAGTLAALATLLLSGPGVRAEAEEPPALRSELAPGPSCSAGQAPDLSGLQALTEQLRERTAEFQPDAAGNVVVGHTPDGQEIVLLNNRGYNYGAGPGQDPSAIQRQLEAVFKERR